MSGFDAPAAKSRDLSARAISGLGLQAMATFGDREVPLWFGTARTRNRKEEFGVVLPASPETKVGRAPDSGLLNFCVTTSPNDRKVGGTVNAAVGCHRQQTLHC